MTDPITAALDRLQEHAAGHPNYDTDEIVARARAALAQPEPEELERLARVEFAEREFNCPSDVILRQYCDDWFYGSPDRNEIDPVDLCRGAIKLFAQTPEPIPVSERLPGPDDCDAEDQCWLWRTDGTEEFWELIIPPNKIHEYNWTSQWKYTHWLPHHTIPTPS